MATREEGSAPVAQAEAATLQSGPCIMCGNMNYSLSSGGPTICPLCDCGDFGPGRMKQQADRIAILRSTIKRLRADHSARIAALEAENAAKAQTIKLQDAELECVSNAMRALGKQLAEAGTERDTLSRQVQGMGEALAVTKERLRNARGYLANEKPTVTQWINEALDAIESLPRAALSPTPTPALNIQQGGSND